MATNSLAVTFDGMPLADVVSGVGAEYFLRSVRGRGLMGMAAQFDNSRGMDGERFLDARLPARDISIEIGLLGASVLDARRMERALSGALHRREPAPLTFADQDGHYDAILTGATVAAPNAQTLTATLAFTCPSPFLWGDQVTTPLVGSHLSVETNYVVEPVVTVTPANPAPAGFTLTVNGKSWAYEGPLAAGQAVVIDSGKRETRIQGALRVLEVSGAYPLLRAENEIELNIGATVSVTYRARWI